MRHWSRGPYHVGASNCSSLASHSFVGPVWPIPSHPLMLNIPRKLAENPFLDWFDLVFGIWNLLICVAHYVAALIFKGVGLQP